MFSLRGVVVRLSLVLSAWVLLPSASFANYGYYEAQCASCHSIAPYLSPTTCNGCHAHGTHASSSPTALAARNLVATVDKSSYVVGDTIKVTLSGGFKTQTDGWVGVRIYDKNGIEVSARKRDYHCTRTPGDATTPCDLAAEVSVTAQEGWTELYVAWAGSEEEYQYITPVTAVTSPISPGSRALMDKNGNAVSRHVEEIVKVTVAVTAAPAPAASGGGGGSFDWLLLSGLMGMFFVRRKAAQ
jgi:hypothetical protein